MAPPLFGSPRGIGRTQSYDSKAAVLAFVRFGSMLSKKSVFANEQFLPEAPDAMPHVGDVAVADRGVPTGATGSHVGFVTDVDLKNGTFTLESGNSSNIYTTRKIGCFSFHTPPNNVLSALIGNGVPSETAIGNALTGLPLSRASIGVYAFVPAISSPDPDDCLDTDNYDEIQNDDSLERIRAPANSFDGERICVLHLPASDAPRFCPYARITRESTMYRAHRRCTATTKGKQCLAWSVRASACFI
jgi:hypothetical protein